MNKELSRWQKSSQEPARNPPANLPHNTPQCCSQPWAPVTNTQRDIPSTPQTATGMLWKKTLDNMMDGFSPYLCYSTFKGIRCITEVRDLKTCILLFNHKISFYFTINRRYHFGAGWNIFASVKENTEKMTRHHNPWSVTGCETAKNSKLLTSPSDRLTPLPCFCHLG